MPLLARKKFKLITVTYWLLLLYIVAALIWWFITLEKQNREMKELQYKIVYSQKNLLTAIQLEEQIASINNYTKRNNGKYLAEGITFFILILIGASFVYSAVRKQFRMQYLQENFMMAITHELKTPIAVAKLNLETLQKHNLDADKQKKIIQMTLNETARLNSLTNNILLSSQLEGERNGFTKDELDFTSLVNDCILEAKNRYPERIFKEQIDPEIEINGDPLLLQMMINNLIENAVKYSAREKSITCLLKKNNNTVVLNILDEGIGIPDNEKKKIFQKFYRIGNENTRKAQGTGLGLYLCRKIAKDHNADISVTNNAPSGSNFAITFYS
jgi:signal transduction histidine kinase